MELFLISRILLLLTRKMRPEFWCEMPYVRLISIGAERMVRINQGERGLEDLSYVIPHNVNLILIPKCESADYVRKLI